MLQCPESAAAGGLKDTVLDFNPEDQSGTGWTFQHCDVQGLMHAIGLALFTLQNHPEDFQALQQRGMSRDSSWEMAASQYEQLFDWAAFDAPFCG
jgi:starch synthase